MFYVEDLTKSALQNDWSIISEQSGIGSIGNDLMGFQLLKCVSNPLLVETQDCEDNLKDWTSK